MAGPPGTVGRALVGEVHICDEDGDELPPGEIGHGLLRRTRRSFEYHNDPEKTAEARL